MSTVVVRAGIKSVAERREEYKLLSNDDLLSEFGHESWSSDRCCSDMESWDSRNCLEALRAELVSRMVNQ